MGTDYTPREVADQIAGSETQLIDVREADEHATGRIAGDRLIELGRLAAEVASIDRDRPVIVYCRSGGRSAMAAQALSEDGFDAHNMTGGLLEWAAVGLPLEPADGTVA